MSKTHTHTPHTEKGNFRKSLVVFVSDTTTVLESPPISTTPPFLWENTQPYFEKTQKLKPL